MAVRQLAVGPGSRELLDRRASVRTPVRAEALVRPRRGASQDPEYAQVEDRSPGGMCIRSAMPVKMGDTLILHVDEETQPLRAKVVWSRREGVLVSRRTGKPCQAQLAGCRVVPYEEKVKKKDVNAAHAWAHLTSLLIRYSILFAGLGLLGVLVYWFVGLVLMMVK